MKKRIWILSLVLLVCFVSSFSQTTNWVKNPMQDSSAIPYALMKNHPKPVTTNPSAVVPSPGPFKGFRFMRNPVANRTGLSTQSAENCSNGIDDDGDGLIDLNDTADCKCNGFGGSSTQVPSMIPNPSFENMACCPSSYSQMSCAQGWVQATGATSDYMNTCGFVFGAATAAGLVPFPSGSGIVGTIFTPGWQEYVGSCLTSPMIAGQSYSMVFNIASTPIDGQGNVCNGGIIDYGPIDITIFGVQGCSNLPQNTFACPSAPWMVLGQTNYNPVTSWGTITITFTPPVNIDAIMIGSPCTLPPGYAPPSGCYPYFYYDNLLLNTTNSFGSLSVSQTGTPCANNIVLTATTDTTGGTWQWFQNGVALAGQTGASLNISANNLPPGTYDAVYSMGGQCEMTSTVVAVPPPPPVASFTSTTVCLGNPTNFTDQSSGTPTSWSWNFGDGNTSTVQNPSHSYAAPGTFTASLIVTDGNGCKDTTQVPVNVTQLPAPTVSSGTICIGNSTTLTASGGTTYAWSPGTGLSSTTGATVTASPGVTTIYTLTATTAGCIGTNTTTVMVNPLPTVSASSGTICVGQQTATLTASGAVSYNWSPSTGLSSTSGTSVTANPGATTTYSVTGTDANGCVNTGTTSVLVNSLPVVSSNTAAICAGQQTATLTASGALTYNWSPGTGLSSTTGTNVNATPGTTTAYTVTGTDANGCFSDGTTTVTVFPLPNVTASSNSPICTGATLNLSTTVGTSWSWSGPNAFSSTQQNPSIANAPVAATGTYSLTATDANGCFASTTIPVTVNPLPTPTATSNSPLCVNQTLNLSSTGGVVYSWNGPNAFSSAQQNPSVTSVTMPANGIYTVTVIDANSCVNSTTVSVTVNPLPVVNATGTVVCENGTITLGTVSGMSTYSWLGPLSFSSNQQNPTISNATPNMSGNYVVTVTDGNNCSSSATALVTVNPLPVVTANNNSPICAGATLTFSCNTGVSWSWTGPNGYASATQNPAIANSTPTLDGTYSVTATDGNGCSSGATTNVTIYPLPVPTATNNSAICAGATLNLSGGGGPSYVWTGPAGFSSSAQNPSLSPATTNMTGTYTLTIVDTHSCVASTTTQVLINPLPVVTTTSHTICLGQPTMLVAGGATTYSWTPNTGLSGTVGNNITANPTSTTAYTVTGVDMNGCANTATLSVLVNPLPPVAVGSTAICLGQTTGTLTATGANTYAWTPPVGLSSTSGSSVTATPAITTGYTVTGTDLNNCVNTATATVTVNPIPIVVISPQSDSGCAPLCVPFANTSGWNGTCMWNFGDGTSLNGCSQTHCFYGKGTYNSVLTLTDANGCVGTSTATVMVYPMPDANFDVTPQPTSILDPTIHFIDGTSGATISTWSWTFGDPLNSTSTVQNPTFVYTSIGMYEAMLTVVTNHGCRDSTVKFIKIDEDYTIYVPNAFSPNGDGTNEIFMAKGDGIKDFKMYIFDRWGNLTFFTDTMNKGWDGRKMGKSDDIVQEDVYVWKIELKNWKGEPRQLSVTVSLLK